MSSRGFAGCYNLAACPRSMGEMGLLDARSLTLLRFPATEHIYTVAPTVLLTAATIRPALV